MNRLFSPQVWPFLLYFLQRDDTDTIHMGFINSEGMIIEMVERLKGGETVFTSIGLVGKLMAYETVLIRLYGGFDYGIRRWKNLHQ